METELLLVGLLKMLKHYFRHKTKKAWNVPRFFYSSISSSSSSSFVGLSAIGAPTPNAIGTKKAETAITQKTKNPINLAMVSKF